MQADISLAQALDAVAHILDNSLDVNHPIYQPLITAVYILYARAFTDNEGVGQLSDKIIPQILRKYTNSH